MLLLTAVRSFSIYIFDFLVMLDHLHVSMQRGRHDLYQ